RDVVSALAGAEAGAGQAAPAEVSAAPAVEAHAAAAESDHVQQATGHRDVLEEVDECDSRVEARFRPRSRRTRKGRTRPAAGAGPPTGCSRSSSRAPRASTARRG